MALLVRTGIDGWMSDAALREELLRLAPDTDIRTGDAPGDLAEIEMIAVSALPPDLPARMPRLRLVQKLGAGVETLVDRLPPGLRIARLKPEAPAREIAEYVLAWILHHQRHLGHYAEAQARRDWAPVEPRETRRTRVAVLGLGHIGGYTARLLSGLGFAVSGWSASPKRIEGVACHHGAAALDAVLAEADHVAAILPSTPATRGLMNARTLAAMKPGAVLINCGRGDLIDEDALLAALDGPLGGAVLDVASREPLPPDSPLWAHPKLRITPHVSGWHLGDAIRDVAENWLRLQSGRPLLHEVDRARGY